MLVGTDFNGGVLTVKLARPEKRNALSTALAEAMAEAFDSHADDADIRVAVLTGTGDRAFASGGDLAELGAIRDLDDARAMADRYRGYLDAIRRFPVPVIAALNGDALGGGAELALACDMRIAAAHARIGFLQGKLAISTAWGGGPDLMAAVGTAKALRLLGRAEILSATAARDWGLIDAVADEGQPFDAFIADYSAGFARRTSAVMRGFKAVAIAQRFGAPRAEQVEIEAMHFAETWVHDDHWAAVEASQGKAGKA